ncbi:dihydrolipoyllysine-residue acetyltransferase [Wenzhouxiangella limi]|uniref:Dihydrolipoamide acetyltransferase component of pyruvate dehydrogenase complex n=1 Tax=Wenzhouxiangella limi TaxID=2707351 RepID=A0A845UYF8_9GAMM|nr:dihydrolipoyllysine-residue acetyltransferase [Wenzhouxiangella limi]NDY95748.1 dihydrolipoyllysine-residue acetyltransferase [Wenzhouxiangella limi]
MSNRHDIRIPDIGDFEQVPVIEILVAEGDTVEAEQSLITLESDKATMDVPSPGSGKLVKLSVAEGDQVSEGDVIGVLESDAEEAGDSSASSDSSGSSGAPDSSQRPPASDSGEDSGDDSGSDSARPETESDGQATASDADRLSRRESEAADRPQRPQSLRGEQDIPGWEDGLPPPPVPFDEMDRDPGSLAHASPSVRKLARELGVDLSRVEGSGRKGRITAEDLKQHVKSKMRGDAAPAASGAGLPDLPAAPSVDFSKFGAVEEKPLSRIQKISGPTLHRNWVSIPHVTQFDEADITEMEAFRKDSQKTAEQAGTKMTPLVFLIKAVVAALKRFPQVNASLSASGESLIHKHYFHVGVAVDTPNGLVVPVLRDCDQKGLLELALELTDLSGRARDGKLKSEEMKGGCFTISSLGGIGGTAFTPIINAPELAILGVSRAETKPVWNGERFEPRLKLPLSLSYDHRVIDGAAAARFTRYLAEQLEDLRRLLL